MNNYSLQGEHLIQLFKALAKQYQALKVAVLRPVTQKYHSHGPSFNGVLRLAAHFTRSTNIFGSKPYP